MSNPDKNIETFHFPEYTNELLKNLNFDRKQRIFTDVVLCSGQEEFHCHKLVLVSSSSYFHAMFTNPFKEQLTNLVDLNDVISPWALGLILDYIYSGKLSISVNTVQDAFQAANILHYPPIVNSCTKFMLNNLTVANCLGMQTLALTYDLVELHQNAHKIALENFASLAKQTEWLSSTFEVVDSFLQRDDLEIRDERVALVALCDWVTHNLDKRVQHFPQLIQHIRLQHIDASQLESDCQELTAFKESNQAREFVKQQLARIAEGACSVMPRVATLKRLSLVLVGGINSEILNSITYLSPTKQTWLPCCSLPTMDLAWFSTVVVANMIVVTGGVRAGVILDHVWIYSPEIDRWTKGASMLRPRAKHTSISVEMGFVFIFGGVAINQQPSNGPTQQPGNRRLSTEVNTVSRQNSVAFLRRTSSTINSRIFEGAPVEGLNGFGHEEENEDGGWPGGGTPAINLVPTIERYDLQADEWTVVGVSDLPRQEACIACVPNNSVSASGTIRSTGTVANWISSASQQPRRGFVVGSPADETHELKNASPSSNCSRSIANGMYETGNILKRRGWECTVLELGGLVEHSPDQPARVRLNGVDQVTLYRIGPDLLVHCTGQFIQLPQPIRFANCVYRESTGLVYIMAELSSQVSVLDLKRNSLKSIAPLKIVQGGPFTNSRIHCGMSWIGERLYVVGGFTDVMGVDQRPANARDDVHCYDPVANTWSRLVIQGNFVARAVFGCVALKI